MRTLPFPRQRRHRPAPRHRGERCPSCRRLVPALRAVMLPPFGIAHVCQGCAPAVGGAR